MPAAGSPGEPYGSAEWCHSKSAGSGRVRVEPAEEIMNILEAYDLTGTLQDATELAGCSHHTVARYAAERERSQAGRCAAEMIYEFMPKLEELIKRSKGEDPRRRGTREDHRDGGLPGPGAPHGGWWRSRRQPGIRTGDGYSAFGTPAWPAGQGCCS